MQTQIVERQELHKTIDVLPDGSVIAMLNFARSLQRNVDGLNTTGKKCPLRGLCADGKISSYVFMERKQAEKALEH